MWATVGADADTGSDAAMIAVYGNEEEDNAQNHDAHAVLLDEMKHVPKNKLSQFVIPVPVPRPRRRKDKDRNR